VSIQGLNTGYSGLAASQLGIDTASHNVANANTKGFTRQRVDQSPSTARDIIIGKVGTGVTVDDITRARDAFLDDRLRSSVSTKAKMEVSADLLGRAESVLGEPDFGLSTMLDDLFASFEDLSLDPSDQGRRITVLNDLSSLTGRFNAISNGFDSLSDDSSTRISVTLDTVNALVDEVAGLNIAITHSASTGTTPNDLLDRRDQRLDQLAQLVGTRVSYQDDGAVRVSLGGLALVDGRTSSHLTWNFGTQLLTHTTGNAVTAGGELGGLQSFIADDLPAIQSRLDSLAVEVHDALNTTHQNGFSSSGVAGGPLLSYNVTNPAGTLAAMLTDPALLATSSDGGTPFQVHNGDNARDLANLRRTLVAAGGTETLSAATRAFVTDVGGRTAGAKQAATTQSNLASAAELSRAASHGVNIDEEMIDLIRYQRAYEAAARVITAADQALDTLINRTGIVGR
jgi:flagellar hook-associated protein 1 FlgK